MVRIDQIQACLISYLKSKQTILDLLSDPNEIREEYWKGTEFSFPCIRVKVNSISQDETDCYSFYEAKIMVFSEEASSRQADLICGTIADEINNKRYTYNGISITIQVTNISSAVSEGETLWRSEMTINGIAI